MMRMWGLLHEQQPFFCQRSAVNGQQPMEINFCKLILKQYKPQGAQAGCPAPFPFSFRYVTMGEIFQEVLV